MSQFFSALVAAFVGFAASVAVVLAAAQALGASDAETVSWVAGLCVAKGIASIWLSLRYRQPIISAWSTPGAALIATSVGVGMGHAVAAFLFAAALMILTALVRPLGQLVARIPMPIASAMLAGVIFRFVVAVFDQMRLEPWLVGGLLIVFMLVRGINPFGAVIAALLAGMAWAFGTGAVLWPDLPPPLALPVVIVPSFDMAVIVGLGVPLYLVGMAAQNLPGFAVLRAAGYEPPTQAALAVTGLTSALSAPFGAHGVTMAAISASICTGADTHLDPARRWVAGVWYGAIWIGLALVLAPVLAVILTLPKALIAAVAGLGLVGSLAGSLGSAMSDVQMRFAAIMTFATAASSLSLAGIGSAFWALVFGLAVLATERALARLKR